jgi:voltage-gated potassium channel
MEKDTRYHIQIAGWLLFILALGTMGYSVPEDSWSLFDAFYMTVITITPVGSGEISRLSPAGRVFTIILIFLGLSAIATFATQVARFTEHIMMADKKLA